MIYEERLYSIKGLREFENFIQNRKDLVNNLKDNGKRIILNFYIRKLIDNYEQRGDLSKNKLILTNINRLVKGN